MINGLYEGRVSMAERQRAGAMETGTSALIYYCPPFSLILLHFCISLLFITLSSPPSPRAQLAVDGH